MITRFHYDQSKYRQFLNHELTTQEHEEIETHVESCALCQDRLESLSHDEAWAELPSLLGRKANTAKTSSGDDVSSCVGFLMDSDQPDSLGTFGRYEVVEVLGRGGMGVVLKGFDRALNRYSAIKVLAPHLASSAAARKRFAREAKSAAAVVHEHVVPIQTVDEENGLPYFVMPVVDGHSLQQRVSQNGPLEIKEILRIGVQIAQGLAAAHEQGLVHRDIKPANVLLENGVERVMLTDFGLARAADDAHMTQSGTLAGTPEYMSPEQARGSDIDSRSDLFSLGSVLYFMCTGHAPFRAHTTMGILHRINSDSQRSLCSVNEEIPQWLDEIVVKLLEKNPDDRFQAAEDVSETLSEWLAYLQRPETATKPPAVPKPRSTAASRDTSGRRRRGWLLAVGTIFALLAGFVISLEFNKGTLTIKCEADDVPVRITKADKVYKRLLIDRGVSSTRIAAGKYFVELDAEVEGLVVKDGVIELSRRGAAIARIVESKRSRQVENNAAVQLAIPAQGVSPDAIRDTALRAERHGIVGPVQIEFIDDSDRFVVRGKKADVDRVMAKIDDLKDQGAANVRGTIDNLAKISRAFHHYANTFGRFPGTSMTRRAIVTKQATYIDDKPTHPYSWRVAILPFIEQNALYDRYRFDEPWDSPHNLELAKEMPDVYRILGPHPDPRSTAIMGFVGNGTALGTGNGVAPREVKDGLSNTTMVVVAAKSVPWTKPEDLVYDADATQAPPSLRHGSRINNEDTLYVAFADQTVGTMQPVNWYDLKALITRNGGEHSRGVKRVTKFSQPADRQEQLERSRNLLRSHIVGETENRLHGIWWDREQNTILAFGAAKHVVVGTRTGSDAASVDEKWRLLSEPAWWKLQPQGGSEKLGLDFYERDDSFVSQAMLKFKSPDVMVLHFEEKAELDAADPLGAREFPSVPTYILERQSSKSLTSREFAKLRSGDLTISEFWAED